MRRKGSVVMSGGRFLSESFGTRTHHFDELGRAKKKGVLQLIKILATREQNTWRDSRLSGLYFVTAIQDGASFYSPYECPTRAS